MKSARRNEAVTGRLIVLLGALSAFAPFATDMYLSAFPAIARNLHSDVAHVQLSLSSFFVGLCAGQLFYGPMTDAWGRRKPLLVGIWVFTAASVLIIVSPNIDWLVGLRFLQAIGGCAGMIVARAVIQDMMDGREAARALSTMMVVQGIGPVLAPVAGAYLLMLGGWKTIFVFMALFGGGCLYATLQLLPESLPPERRTTLHLGRTLASFGSLLRRGQFLAPALSAALALAALFAYIGGAPFVIMTLHGLDQQHFSWLFAVNALGMTGAAWLNKTLLRRYAPGTLLRAATVVMCVATAALFALRGAGSLYVIGVPLFVAIACVPAVAANASALAMAAGAERAGSASSLLGAMQFAVAAVASALVTALHDDSATPMTAVMLGGALIALVFAWLHRRGDAAPA